MSDVVNDSMALEDVLASLEEVARYARCHDLDRVDEVLTDVIGQLLATAPPQVAEARRRVLSRYDA